MNKNFVESLTLNERISNNLVHANENKTINWFARKSLLKEYDIQEMISQQYSSYKNFVIGIGDFKSNFSNSISKQMFPWVEQFYTYLNDHEETYTLDDTHKTIDYSIRFLIQKIKKNVNEITMSNKFFKFENEFLINVIDSYISEIMIIANQTIIADMNSYKEDGLLSGKDKYERFQSYLDLRFGDINKIKQFYSDYPYLIRIIIQRTNFFNANFKELIDNLNEDFCEFKSHIGINENTLKSIDMSMGDTHDKGKSVSILHFQGGKKIVYKPKNLKIAKEIDSFMLYLNKHIDTDFYIPKRLVKDDHAFEEFIEQVDLTDSKDAAVFYKTYGSLLGFAYILNGSDFHYENIIAYKHHPIIIDMETFFHEPAPLYYDQELKSMVREKLSESVIGTSMLPIEIMQERSKDSNQGIDLSGLSFGRHKFPFNVLVLKDASTDEMRYEWGESYVDECNNVPIKDGHSIAYTNFKQQIYDGFVDFLKKIEINKINIQEYIKKHFSNKKVRQIVRPTQKYTDLLRYSYHPSCMEDGIEREKVLHNLWAYSYKNKLIAKFEFEEMMLGDIPQFFINTSEKSLYSNDSLAIKDIFKETPLEIVIRKVKALNDDVIQQQLNTIKSSFQEFKFQDYPEFNNFTPHENDGFSKELVIDFVNGINQYIIKNAIISEKDKKLTFLDIQDGDKTQVLSLSEGLYNGLSGIYLFLVANDYINDNRNNLMYREYISNLIITSENKSAVNAFFSKSSMIYPLLVEYALLKEESSLKIAEQLAQEAMTSKKLTDSDWLYGSLNMIPIYYALYEITKKSKYLDFCKEIFSSTDFKKSNFIGFAHGESSFYYINSIINSFDPFEIENIIKEEDSYRSDKRWRSEKDKEVYFSGWCKGDLGIEISRLASFHNHSSSFLEACRNSVLYKNNNTLCHGNSSLLELLIQMKNKKLLTSNEYEKEVSNVIKFIFDTYRNYKNYGVYSGLNGDSLGLFTGISGLGYQLIRILDNKVPNVLLFETPDFGVELHEFK